ncbi:MAG: sensor histidine kinase [Clostridia bacterium]|nr:sensor histidine kinase [Clostridia bacterium]
MSIFEYFKEKWLTYLFFAAGITFSVIIYKLDRHFAITESNATYIMAGMLFLLVTYIIIDYLILNARIKKFRLFCELNTFSFDEDEFYHPMDLAYAKMVRGISLDYEKFKAGMETRTAEEIDFITKWIHDIKVPVSAIRLILESNENSFSQDSFRRFDMELTTVEKYAQAVFYQLKSSAFYNDFKITQVSTKRLIADSLKSFSSFFIYRKIGILIPDVEEMVLTDEKWSGYIISQIISNAIKYTNENGQISIQVLKDAENTDIIIRNTGMGILEEDINQIFMKGYTRSDQRNSLKATGYGMYLSKKLSDLMGHELCAQSTYGEYAQFTLRFHNEGTNYNVTKM